MIRKIFYRLLAPRHPWRAVSFSELSEMYLAVFLRTVAVSLVSVFVPLFLLRSGYSLTAVFVYYTLFYSYGIGLDIAIAYLIARFGPKHIMRLSLLFSTLFTFLLTQIDKIPYPIPVIAFVCSLSATAYWLPYHIDFSKIKHSEHGGKEIGFLQIVDRIAAILGPIAGGLLATFVNPRATFYASGIAMLIAAVVLLLSPEPVQTHQKIRFKGLRIVPEWRSYVSYTGLAIDSTASVILWPVFLAAVVFSSKAYLKIGTVSSISVLVAILVAIPLGRLLDKERGKLMVRYGSVVNAIVHLARLAVNGLPGSVAITAVNEPNTLIYKMALLKGFYDYADDHPGYRIAYVTCHELVTDVTRTIFWGTLAVLTCYLSAYQVCAIGFVIAAGASLAMRVERYPALH